MAARERTLGAGRLLAIVAVPLLATAPRAAAQENDAERAPLEVRAVRYSPDGAALAVGFGTANSPGEVQVWDMSDNRLRFRRVDQPGVGAVAWSPDGTRVAIGNYAGEVRILAADDGRAVQELRGHTNGVCGAEFSSSGEWLATASWDYSARIWRTDSGEVAHVLQHDDVVNAVAFSPDRELLATASHNGSARFWRVATGELRRSFAHDGTSVQAADLSPNGMYLAAGSADRRLRFWNCETGEPWMEFNPTVGSVDCVCFSADGLVLAAAGMSGRRVALVRLRTEPPDEGETRRIAELLALLDDDDYAVRQQADEELAAFGMAAELALREALDSASVEVRIRARRLRERATSPRPMRVLVCDSPVASIDFSPRGGLLAIGQDDGRVLILDVESGEEVDVLGE